ncbi:MAG: hypothetical protein KC457_07875, partial [Myxococcales bacterium]|nr:hypothetical protein [Myxococcales bacterium]
GEALGPLQDGAATATRPVAAVPEWFRARAELQHDVATLQAENSDLRGRLETSGYDRNRLAEYDRLTALAGETARVLVPARVIGWGPQQSFARTPSATAPSARSRSASSAGRIPSVPVRIPLTARPATRS